MSAYSYIWTLDKRALIYEFLDEKPHPAFIREKVKYYDSLAEEILALPDYYDVGAIRLRNGELFIFNTLLFNL